MGAPERVDHDIAPGPLKRCQITGSENLNLVIDLGHQPPCDALVTDPDAPETTYPLRLMHCPDSGLAQLDYVVPGEVVYPATGYPYRAGISWPLVEYQGQFADDLTRRFGTEGLYVDIGCNDGTLLAKLRERGARALGVEPTNVGQAAPFAPGLDIRQEFFTERLAREIGPARVVTMTNVFAHMADLGEVMRGICALLEPTGVFVTESHYLLDVLEKNQFDTVYHEHIRNYSLKALMHLFPQYGLEVFDVQRCGRYGGNIRAYVGWRGLRPVERTVGDLLTQEDVAGLHEPATWQRFASRVRAQRDGFMDFMTRAHMAGALVVGCSAPGRASTLLNYYGVTKDLMPWTGELDGSLKRGKWIPGCHIPVVDNRKLRDDKPDYVVLLAWHYAEPIIKRLREEGVRCLLVQPLPEMRMHA